MRLAVAVSLLSVLVYSRPASATEPPPPSELSLSWLAPPACPQLASLQESLAIRQKRRVALGPNAPLRVEASVVTEHDGFRLELVTATRSGRARRVLVAPSCNELARATLLMASLLLSTPETSASPESSSPAPAASARVPELSTVALRVSAAAALDLGRLSRFSPGASLGLGVDLASLRLRAGASYLPSRNVDVSSLPGAHVELQLIAAELSACYALRRAPRLSPCVFAELGSLRARGVGLSHDEHSASVWWLGGVAAQLSVGLAAWLDLDSELSVGFPARRAQISTRDTGVVYQVPAVTGQLRVGLSLHFH
jgi:hypothetical protein